MRDFRRVSMDKHVDRRTHQGAVGVLCYVICIVQEEGDLTNRKVLESILRETRLDERGTYESHIARTSRVLLPSRVVRPMLEVSSAP
jgi:hypothetical protein